jgi:hypothetical protein
MFSVSLGGVCERVLVPLFFAKGRELAEQHQLAQVCRQAAQPRFVASDVLLSDFLLLLIFLFDHASLRRSTAPTTAAAATTTAATMTSVSGSQAALPSLSASTGP